MSVDILSRDSGGGRAIEPTGGTGGDTPPPSSDASRWLAPVRQATSRGSMSLVPWVGDGQTPLSTIYPTSYDSVTGQRYYLGNDQFSVLADAFVRMFGADNPASGEQQFSVVPTEVGGNGGGNMVLILLLLAAAGFGIWYFYFRGGN